MKITTKTALKIMFWGTLTLLFGRRIWFMAQFIASTWDGLDLIELFLTLAVLYFLVRLIWRGFTEHSPDMLCRHCKTWVIPRIDFRTKSEGYCPCCGAIMWQKGGQDTGLSLDLIPIAQKAWRKYFGSKPGTAAQEIYCPDCKTLVTTLRDAQHGAYYCSSCGVVLAADRKQIA
jgi:ribosomal protein S27E